MRLHPLFMVYKVLMELLLWLLNEELIVKNRLFLLLFNKRFSNLFVCPKQWVLMSKLFIIEIWIWIMDRLNAIRRKYWILLKMVQILTYILTLTGLMKFWRRTLCRANIISIYQEVHWENCDILFPEAM